MTYIPTHLDEGLRMVKRKLNISLKGFKRYKGDAKEICKQIVAECWNGKFFQASAGHFSEFYMRDFGMCVESLIKLGFLDEVRKSLRYALSEYSSDKLTTTITPRGKCMDCFSYGPDSLAFLLRSLVLAKDKKLVSDYKDYLNKEIKKYRNTVLDKNGLVRKDKLFSTMKDGYKRKSSCYDNCMSWVIADCAKRLGLNSIGKFNFKKIIKDNFWNGSYFIDDLSGTKHIAGDTNVMPYWLGIFDDKKMLKSSIDAMRKEKLDVPFPLKYTAGRHRKNEMFHIKYLAPNYEGNSIWFILIGPAYIKIVSKVDKKLAKEYLRKYTKVIEKHGNYLELFNPDGSLYVKTIYAADSGMLWASTYLDLTS